MGLSKLSEKCRICPKVDTCKNKRMEAVGFMAGPCERELAAGVTIQATVPPGAPTPMNIEDFFEEVEKRIAVAAQVPQYILCKHMME